MHDCARDCTISRVLWRNIRCLIGVAVTRLDQSAREVDGHRVGAFIVLLTDGANNRGVLTPMQAAGIASRAYACV